MALSKFQGAQSFAKCVLVGIAVLGISGCIESKRPSISWSDITYDNAIPGKYRVNEGKKGSKTATIRLRNKRYLIDIYDPNVKNKENTRYEAFVMKTFNEGYLVIVGQMLNGKATRKVSYGILRKGTGKHAWRFNILGIKGKKVNGKFVENTSATRAAERYGVILNRVNDFTYRFDSGVTTKKLRKLFSSNSFLKYVNEKPLYSFTRVSGGSPSDTRPSKNRKSVRERLKELKQLYDDGLIEKKDYDRKRADILKSL